MTNDSTETEPCGHSLLHYYIVSSRSQQITKTVNKEFNRCMTNWGVVAELVTNRHSPVNGADIISSLQFLSIEK